MVEPDHGARDHATCSASSMARNWACAGALPLSQTITTPEVESHAAAWGTGCHQVSEKCLRTGKDAAEFIGTVEKTKQHEIDVDEELAETAQVYIDYVRGRIAEYVAATGEQPIVKYEQKFSLTEALNTPYDAGGTGDTVIYFPAWKLIEVVDLKGGRGLRVEVAENKQLRTYALGAMIENSGLDIERVMSTIVQPRMQHKDGRTRDETLHVADLAEWTADLLERMYQIKAAEEALAVTLRTSNSIDEWAGIYLKPGDHCTFCRAEGICPAKKKKALEVASVWFDDQGQMQARDPLQDSPEKIAETLDQLDFLTSWINAYRANAKAQAEAGVKIPDHQLSETIGHRKFTDEVKVVELFVGELTDEQLYNRKLKSPAQLEKTLGARRLKIFADDLKKLTVRPVTGVNLVRADKTTRAAVPGKAERFFEPVTTEKE